MEKKRTGRSVDASVVWVAEGLFRSEEEIDNSAWYGTRLMRATSNIRI
ncbi:hypothetical protein NXV15_24135 [Bacteroides thetaiotaomicron]|nr:hypothetical protein [Bacteroides thetaiotaomicron]